MNKLVEFNTSDYGDGADAITGERMIPGENVLDTRINNIRTYHMGGTLTRFVKESTIVWLATEAGYTLTRSNEGNPINTENVDGKNASVGGGKTPLGETPPRGK